MIVILVVIALISTPIILSVIEKSKIGANRDSIYGMTKGIEIDYFKNGSQMEQEYKIADGQIVGPEGIVAMEGTVVGIGKAKIDQKGRVGLYTEKGDYCYVKNLDANTVSATKGNCEPHNFWQVSKKFPYQENGITMDYDPETQIFSIDGTISKSGFFTLHLMPFQFQKDEIYTVGYEFVSGKQDAFGTVSFEALDSNGNLFPDGERQYADPFLSENQQYTTKSFTVSENTAQKSNYARMGVYILKGTYEKYRFRVSVVKGTAKQYIPSTGF